MRSFCLQLLSFNRCVMGSQPSKTVKYINSLLAVEGNLNRTNVPHRSVTDRISSVFATARCVQELYGNFRASQSAQNAVTLCMSR
jgi:hypothetical protein